MKELFQKLHTLNSSNIKHKIRAIFRNGGRLSYSQCGEDMILDIIFNDIKKGFYIDIGANNPFVQSNTYHFYRKGWQGINVDALPDSMRPFNKFRKRDINIENAISDTEEVLEYYMFSSTFYNCFSKEEAEKRKSVSKLLEIRKLKTQKLSDLLDKHIIKNIDFMSVDVEGFDLKVLKSNNWDKYRPKVILTEYYAKNLDEVKETDVYNFLNTNNYTHFCNTPTNSFYLDNNFLSARFGVSQV